MHPLDELLSSKGRIAVMRVLCLSAVPLSGREVARRAGIDAGNASRLLRDLAATGMLVRRDHGRTVTYERVRPAPPLVEKMAEFFEEERRQYDEILSELAREIPCVVSIILYGSEARGEAGPTSDTDLLIVVSDKDSESETDQALLGVAERYGLHLSWEIADLHDLRRWDKAGHSLWRNILSEGVALYGKSPERLKKTWLTGETD